MTIGRFSIASLLVLVAAATASAQPGGGRGGPGGGRFGGGGGGFPGFGGESLVDLALRDDVGKELEIVEDQKKDIEAIREKLGESMRGRREELQNVPREELFAKLREMSAEANTKAEKELDEVLLPHQLKRLKQLQFQRRSRGGAERALTNEDLAKELGLTEQQIEKIREAAEKAQEELRAKMEELRKEAQEQILAVLTPQQRKAWEEMAGEPFEFENTFGRGGPGGPGGGGFGGRGGQPGQPGGGRGGNRGGRPQAE